MSSFNVTHPLTPPTLPTPPNPGKQDDTFNVAMTIGLPLVVMFLILLSLCMVLVYTKARRRAAASSQQNPVTTIAGGVPMSTSAFMNYTGQNSTAQLHPMQNTSDALHIPQQQVIMAPPSYEDAMKEISITCATDNVNVSYSPLRESINHQMSHSVREPPPAYDGPATSEHCHGNSFVDPPDDACPPNEEENSEVVEPEANNTNSTTGDPVTQDHNAIILQNSHS